MTSLSWWYSSPLTRNNKPVACMEAVVEDTLLTSPILFCA